MNKIVEILVEGFKAAKPYREDAVITSQQPTDELLEECECDGMAIPAFDAHSPSQEELDEADEWIGESSVDDSKGSEDLKNFGVI